MLVSPSGGSLEFSLVVRKSECSLEDWFVSADCTFPYTSNEGILSFCRISSTARSRRFIAGWGCLSNVSRWPPNQVVCSPYSVLVTEVLTRSHHQGWHEVVLHWHTPNSNVDIANNQHFLVLHYHILLLVCDMLSKLDLSSTKVHLDSVLVVVTTSVSSEIDSHRRCHHKVSECFVLAKSCWEDSQIEMLSLPCPS